MDEIALKRYLGTSLKGGRGEIRGGFHLLMKLSAINALSVLSQKPLNLEIIQPARERRPEGPAR